MAAPQPLSTITVSPNVPACLSLSPVDFLASRPHLAYLMAGTLVFRTEPNSSTPQLQTLLIRRASTDSYPLKWERPAGTVSPLDATVLSCAVRELLEETGLHVSHVECPVGVAEMSGDLRGWGIDPEEERAELQAGDEAQTVAFWDEGGRWGIVTLVVDVEEDLSRDGVDGETVVRLDPQEHEEWTWATEVQVRTGMTGDGREMEFTSKAVWETLLEGFRIKRELDAVLARASVS